MADADDDLTAEELAVLERIRRELRAGRWRIVVAYFAITVVFACGLWSYRSTVDSLKTQQRQQQVANCLALNELRLDLGAPLDNCYP